MATVVVTRWRKNLVQQKNDRINLTPTGLLMEGEYTQNPIAGSMSVMAIFQQLSRVGTVRGRSPGPQDSRPYRPEIRLGFRDANLRKERFILA